MSKTNSGLFNTNPLSPIAKKAFIQELRNRGEKFNEEKIVFITKDATGQIIWLEKGNNLAGLEHIIQRHSEHFEKAFGFKQEQIPNFLEDVITHGTIISNKITMRNGREGFERIYERSGNYYILAGIGSNGFIVSARPAQKEYR